MSPTLKLSSHMMSETLVSIQCHRQGAAQWRIRTVCIEYLVHQAEPRVEQWALPAKEDLHVTFGPATALPGDTTHFFWSFTNL